LGRETTDLGRETTDLRTEEETTDWKPEEEPWIKFHTPPDKTYYSLEDRGQQELIPGRDSSGVAMTYRTFRFSGLTNAHVGLFCGARPEEMREDYTT
jgi:hypothetical protein